MSKPILWLLVGPNGAGKSTFYRCQLAPRFPSLPFVNADVIAAQRWPDAGPERAYEAARLAHEERERLLDERASFIAETVFSHPSKLDLITTAKRRGYLVVLVYVYVPVEVAVARVAYRVQFGGHAVPEEKVRERHARLQALVAQALTKVNRAFVYDNGRVNPDRDGLYGGRTHVPIASVTEGVTQWLVSDPPEWATALLPVAG